MMKTTFNLTAKSVVGFLFFFQKKGGNHAVAFPILFFYLCNCQGNGSCTTLADILDESVLFHPSSEIRTISRIRDKQRSSSPCMAICPSWAFPLLDVILSPRPPRRLLLLLHRTLGRPPGRGGKEASYRSITVGPSPPAIRPEVIQTRKKPGNRLAFRVWMTGLEPATSWSLTRCATNCATSRGIGIAKVQFF